MSMEQTYNTQIVNPPTNNRKKIVVGVIAALFFILAIYFQSKSSPKKPSSPSSMSPQAQKEVEAGGCGMITITQNDRDLSYTKESQRFTCLIEAAKSCTATSAIVNHTLVGGGNYVRTYQTIISLTKRANGCEMRFERGPLTVQKYTTKKTNTSIEKQFNSAYEHRTGVCLYKKNNDLVTTLQNWDLGALPQPGSGADYGQSVCSGEYFEPVLIKLPLLEPVTK